MCGSGCVPLCHSATPFLSHSIPSHLLLACGVLVSVGLTSAISHPSSADPGSGGSCSAWLELWQIFTQVNRRLLRLHCALAVLVHSFASPCLVCFAGERLAFVPLSFRCPCWRGCASFCRSLRAHFAFCCHHRPRRTLCGRRRCRLPPRLAARRWCGFWLVASSCVRVSASILVASLLPTVLASSPPALSETALM